MEVGFLGGAAVAVSRTLIENLKYDMYNLISPIQDTNRWKEYEYDLSIV